MERILLKSLQSWDGQGVVSVLGPTGSGKTRLVLEEVQRRWSQNPRWPLLVSVDAVALFKRLNIGSAKPLGLERDPYDWAGLDILDPHQKPSAAIYIEAVATPLREALQSARPVVLVGGSNFYERALVEGQSPGGVSDASFQASLESLSNEQLYERLLACDSGWAEQVHASDRYRLKRFLDLAERQGLSLHKLFEQAKEKPEGLEAWTKTWTLIHGMENSQEAANKNLESRLHQMLDQGWEAETRALLDSGLSPQSTALQSVGYKDIVETLRGWQPPSSLPARILSSHRRLAKKQRTWCRGLLRRMSGDQPPPEASP